MPVINNKYNGTFAVHATANESLTIAGNTSVSNVALLDETLTGAVINQVWYGANSDTTSWKILRGANTVAVFNGTGHAQFGQHGQSLNIDPGATLVIQKTGGDGFILVECKKTGTKHSVYNN